MDDRFAELTGLVQLDSSLVGLSGSFVISQLRLAHRLPDRCLHLDLAGGVKSNAILKIKQRSMILLQLNVALSPVVMDDGTL